MHEGSRMVPRRPYGATGEPTTTASSRAAARFWSSGAGGRYRIPPDSRGVAWGYVSCRNALSDSGSLVTVSMLKRGEESLNPFTMQ